MYFIRIENIGYTQHRYARSRYSNRAVSDCAILLSHLSAKLLMQAN